MIHENAWQERFKERGQHYYLFLREWASFVKKKLVINDSIPWHELPGYKTLLNSFFSDIMSRDNEYPETLC